MAIRSLVRIRLLVVALLVALMGLAPHRALGQDQGADYETVEVAEGVYQFRWSSHNSLVVVGSAGVTVIDPISVDAARVLASEIGRIAPGKPLSAVMYSHHHRDHATGAAELMRVLGQDAPIIAHENALPQILAFDDAELPPPTITFAESADDASTGRAVELHYLGPSHSDNLVVALVPDVGLAFAVDFVSNDRVGFRDLPGWDFPGQFRAMEAFLELEFESVVFGHGPVGDRRSVSRQLAYWSDLRALVAEALDKGLSEDEAADRLAAPAYAAWSQYEAWFPLNVRGMYRWLASR